MATPWLLLLPVAGAGWWMLGFPPGWGWIVVPPIPSVPVNVGEVVSLGLVVLGMFGGLAWLRNNL
jgi:hypothetical protein